MAWDAGLSALSGGLPGSSTELADRPPFLTHVPNPPFSSFVCIRPIRAWQAGHATHLRAWCQQAQRPRREGHQPAVTTCLWRACMWCPWSLCGSCAHTPASVAPVAGFFTMQMMRGRTCIGDERAARHSRMTSGIRGLSMVWMARGCACMHGRCVTGVCHHRPRTTLGTHLGQRAPPSQS